MWTLLHSIIHNGEDGRRTGGAQPFWGFLAEAAPEEHAQNGVRRDRFLPGLEVSGAFVALPDGRGSVTVALISQR